MLSSASRTPAQQRVTAISYLTISAIAGLAVALTLGTLTPLEFTALLVVLTTAAVHFARRQFRPATRQYSFENWAVFHDKFCFAAREWNYASPVHTDGRCWTFASRAPQHRSGPGDTLTLELTGPHCARITGPAATIHEADRRLPGGTGPASVSNNRRQQHYASRVTVMVTKPQLFQ